MLRQTKASCLGLGSGLDEGMGGPVVTCALSECEGQCVGRRGAQVGGCGGRLWWEAVVGGYGGGLWWEAVGACGSMYKRSIAASRGTWRVGAGPPLRAWAWTATRSWCSEACVVRGRAWARVGVPTLHGQGFYVKIYA